MAGRVSTRLAGPVASAAPNPRRALYRKVGGGNPERVPRSTRAFGLWGSRARWLNRLAPAWTSQDWAVPGYSRAVVHSRSRFAYTDYCFRQFVSQTTNTRVDCWDDSAGALPVR